MEGVKGEKGVLSFGRNEHCPFFINKNVRRYMWIVFCSLSRESFLRVKYI